MVVGISIEGIIVLLSAIPIFLTIYSIRGISTNYDAPAFTFLQISWGLLALNLIFLGTAVTFHFPWFFTARLVIMAVSTIFLDYGLSLLEFERVRSFRFGVTCSLSSLLVYSSLTTPSYYVTQLAIGQMTYKLQGTTFVFFVLIAFWMLILYTFFFFRIYDRTTGEKQQPALRLLLVTLIGGLTVILSFSLRINKFFPGIDALSLSITMFLMLIIIEKDPRLLFFNFDPPLKLIIMEIDSGNKIFDYNWTENKIQIPTQLFATALESIHIFIKESLKQGKLKEIVLDEGVLLIRHEEEQNISFALLVNSTSYVVRKNFDRFIRRFNRSRMEFIKERNIVIVDNDHEFIKLVEESF